MTLTPIEKIEKELLSLSLDYEATLKSEWCESFDFPELLNYISITLTTRDQELVEAIGGMKKEITKKLIPFYSEDMERLTTIYFDIEGVLTLKEAKKLDAYGLTNFAKFIEELAKRRFIISHK